MEIGGQRVLINPNFEGAAVDPKKVHEQFDYVVFTTAKPEFFDRPSVLKMFLTKVNFIATKPAGERLQQMGARNVAILNAGPGGQVLLKGPPGSAELVVFVTPGAGFMPWEDPESGFVFVNGETGIAVGYESVGLYCGRGAGTNPGNVPEEAYQVDYIVTPDLAEAAGIVKGLTEKGAVLRGVVKLPDPRPADAQGGSPFSFLALSSNDPEAFLSFLKQQGAPLSETKLFQPLPGGEPVILEG